MILSKLIRDLKVKKTIGKTDVEIKNIVIDSKLASKNALFICISGTGFDGHDYIRQAENYGASAIITEKECDCKATQIIVENTRVAMSVLAAEFYGHADKKMKIVGITGTNGKTTTTYILKNILEKAGLKCGIIGTLGVIYGDVYREPTLTTPDPLDLHEIFADMHKSGIKVVVMEVSAHALFLDKVEGINFEVGIFTNLTQDHLDFFENLENYKKAKMKLFENGRCKFVVSNSDDEVGLEIIKTVKNAVSYGIDNPADVFAVNINESDSGTEYFINLFDRVYEIKTPLIGRFNVYNSLAAATASALLGVKTDAAEIGLSDIKTVSGRMEKVYGEKFDVFIDYAHTPDGLKKSLESLKCLCKKRLICVFGCGGNRDVGKRRLMGKISGEIADFTVITSDNPRYEEPMKIIGEIEKGMMEATKNYVIVQNRTEGIKYALDYAKDGDTVLIAGKGSERYQEILGTKHIYNDKDAVKEILNI